MSTTECQWDYCVFHLSLQPLCARRTFSPFSCHEKSALHAVNGM